MPKTKIADANNTFSSNFQKALSTLTPSQWNVINHAVKGEQIRLYTLVPPGLILRNRSGKKLFVLSASLATQLVDREDGRGKKVKTREYIYKITSCEDQKSLYEFHWHPEKIDMSTLETMKPGTGRKPPFPTPHIHVRANDPRFKGLRKKHIPSGRVAFEDVLSFLFNECDVKTNRNDWERVLRETRKVFQETKTW